MRTRDQFFIPTCRLVSGGNDDDNGRQAVAEAPSFSAWRQGGRTTRGSVGSGVVGVRAPLPDLDLVFMSYEQLKKDLKPLHK